MKKRLVLPLIISSSLMTLFSCQMETVNPLNKIELNVEETNIVENQKITLNPIFDDGAVSSYDQLIWSSSNNNVARVDKGVVTFGDVKETKNVTITVKDQQSEVSDSIEFTVYDTSYNLSNYDVNYTKFISNNIFQIEDSNFTILNNQFNEKTCYYQVAFKNEEITRTTKNGLIISDNKNLADSTNAFLVTLNNGNEKSNYIYVYKYNKVDDSFIEHYASYPLTQEITLTDYFNLGIIKENNKLRFTCGKIGNALNKSDYLEIDEFNNLDAFFSIYGEDSSNLKIRNTLASIDISEFKVFPENISLNDTSISTNINSTYQINYSVLGEYDNESIKFTSTDDSIATVSSTGLITTTSKAGICYIYLMYANTTLVKQCKLINYLTTDENVVLDGKMDDSFYKRVTHVFAYYGLNSNTYIEIYAAKASFGIYLFANQYIKTLRNIGSDWWQQDNFEIRIVANGKVSNQIQYSTINNGYFNTGEGKVIPVKEYSYGDYNYLMVTESYLPYSTLAHTIGQVDYNSTFGFSYGINDHEGWKATSNFGSTDTSITRKINSDGIYF